MKTALIIFLLSVILLTTVAFFRLAVVRRKAKKLLAKKYEKFQGLIDRLKRNEPVNVAEISELAENVATRETLYNILRKHNKTELFPSKFIDFVHAGESHLVNWLEFPTELGRCPDRIEHIKRVSYDYDGEKHMIHYELFRFRVNEPKEKSQDGWLLGVVGPYFDESNPYDVPASTFSRLSREDKITPEEEAEWVYKNITLRYR